MRCLPFIAVLLLLQPVAAGQFYACVKPGGGVSYVSDPNAAGCKPVRSYEESSNLKIVPVQPSPPVVTPPPRASSGGQATARRRNYPTVLPQEQRQRDQARGEILRHELAQEMRLKKIVGEQIALSGDGDEQKQAYLQEQLRIHTQNITAIEQELARLK